MGKQEQRGFWVSTTLTIFRFFEGKIEPCGTDSRGSSKIRSPLGHLRSRHLCSNLSRVSVWMKLAGDFHEKSDLLSNTYQCGVCGVPPAESGP